ncbi:M23 family metallopeptidase [Haloglycomyces albus]|uniref:M23 family metallopeptidase n=1 Tax=Haloglycomyces albus TaxID=526067 RepID=UPI0004B68FEE|nr:M23 family metallopeptidase [Haloglycomyces albus]
MSSIGLKNPTSDGDHSNVDDRPIRRHAARPHRLRGRHRAKWTAEIAPFLEGTQKRYAAVLGAAVVGASTVALSSAATLPDNTPDSTANEAIADIASNARVPQHNTAVNGAHSGTGNVENGSTDGADEASESREVERRNIPHSEVTVQSPERRWVEPLKDIMITSQYGPRWGSSHNGVDFSAATGDPIYAVYPGEVVTAGWEGGFGRLVILDHGDGVQTYYAHNSELLVEPGQWVEAGDQISKAGNTGFSLGSHLHLEVHDNGTPVEPLSFLQEKGLSLR